MGARIRSIMLRTGRIGLAAGMLIALLGVCFSDPVAVCAGCGVSLMGGYSVLFGEVGSL